MKPSEERRVSANMVHHHFSSSAGFRWLSSKSGSFTVFPEYNCLSEFWIHVGGDRDRTLSS